MIRGGRSSWNFGPVRIAHNIQFLSNAGDRMRPLTLFAILGIVLAGCANTRAFQRFAAEQDVDPPATSMNAVTPTPVPPGENADPLSPPPPNVDPTKGDGRNIGIDNAGSGNIGIGNVGVGNVGISNSGDFNIGIDNSGWSNIGIGNSGTGNIGIGLSCDGCVGIEP